MKSSLRFSQILAVALPVLMLGGCASYRQVVPPSQLELYSVQDMDILMRDGRTYRIDAAKVTAEAITGTGREFVGDSTTVPFEGSLARADIALVQIRSRDVLGPLLVTAATIAVIAAATDNGGDEASGYAIVTNPNWSGYGSCPFVYAFDGADYRLDAESFAGSVCAELEQTTRSVLPSLVPVDSVLTVALCNQAAESQYVNAASLFAVDHPVGTNVVVDTGGAVRLVSLPVSASRARDQAGVDVTALVAAADGRAWTTDPAAIDPADEATLCDGLACEFPCPAGDGRGLLVLRVVNTRLAEFGVHKLLTLCGPQKLAWCRDLGRDPWQKAAFVGWMVREGALHVQLRDGDGWRTVGVLPPVGAVMAERAVEVDLSGTTDATVEIRLVSGAGIWRIDQVSLADADSPLADLVALPLQSLRGTSPAMTAATISAADASYLPLMPGDWAVAEFAGPTRPARGAYAYVLQAGGHYYPWVEEGARDQRDLVARILAEPLLGSKLFIAEGLAQCGEVAAPVAPMSLPRPVAVPWPLPLREGGSSSAARVLTGTINR